MTSYTGHADGTCNCASIPCTEGHVGAEQGHCACGERSEKEGGHGDVVGVQNRDRVDFAAVIARVKAIKS